MTDEEILLRIVELKKLMKQLDSEMNKHCLEIEKLQRDCSHPNHMIECYSQSHYIENIRNPYHCKNCGKYW